MASANDLHFPARAYARREVENGSFTDAVVTFLDGTSTPRAYLEGYLEQLEAQEPQIKAFVHFDIAKARAQADLSTERYRTGQALSALDGLPIGVKDVIDTEDFPTAYGSKLFAGHQPLWDAACVYWLKKAGAIIVGKTVTTEFATQPPGPTRNPWDLTRTPGGSSSGSAAAVASGMVPLALGTQVKGSLMRPAGYCGVFGLKPTYGVISNQGLLPFSRGINHLGTLARSLEDAWRVVYLLSRSVGGEPGYSSLPAALSLVPAATKPRRIALLETLGWGRTPAAAAGAYEGLQRALTAQGIELVTRKDIDSIEQLEILMTGAPEMTNAFRDWECRYPLIPYYERAPDKIEAETVGRIQKSLSKIEPERYDRALRQRERIRQAYEAIAEVADACMTLTTPGPAPVGFQTGDSSFIDVFSIIGCPTLSLPLLTVDGLPQGVQLTGFNRRDEQLVGHGLWLTHCLGDVS